VLKQTRLVGFVVLTLVLPVAAADAPEAERARAAAAAVLEETKSVLQSAMSGGNPATALRVCASAAQGIARKHEREGWRVRRVSDKIRNPADTPDSYERDVLSAWQAEKKAGRLVPTTEHLEIVTESGRSALRYMKPIVIAAPVCLQCHGDPAKLAPGVAEALRELYPNDQATGYSFGDLRGAISVSIPVASPR
jgi:uncharacterized protein DUF3365